MNGIDAFFVLHSGLSRQGPGAPEVVAYALLRVRPV